MKAGNRRGVAVHRFMLADEVGSAGAAWLECWKSAASRARSSISISEPVVFTPSRPRRLRDRDRVSGVTPRCAARSRFDPGSVNFAGPAEVPALSIRY